jgi:hypothetical protein
MFLALKISLPGALYEPDLKLLKFAEALGLIRSTMPLKLFNAPVGLPQTLPFLSL